MKTIAICSSADFYEEVVRIKHELEMQGFIVLIPATALKMEASGDYDVAAYKTWYGNVDDYHKKTDLMRGHFDEIAKADAVLVVNNEKRGVPNYIGGNVLMEMAVAFHLKLPLFLLNNVPAESPFLEEIIGLGAAPLKGDLRQLAVSLSAD